MYLYLYISYAIEYIFLIYIFRQLTCDILYTGDKGDTGNKNERLFLLMTILFVHIISIAIRFLPFYVHITLSLIPFSVPVLDIIFHIFNVS